MVEPFDVNDLELVEPLIPALRTLEWVSFGVWYVWCLCISFQHARRYRRLLSYYEWNPRKLVHRCQEVTAEAFEISYTEPDALRPHVVMRAIDKTRLKE
jgi:hypothetical protein